MFAGMPDDELGAMAAMVSYREFPKGSFILTQNDRGSVMYFLISGRVKISVASPEGKELALNYLEAPAHFGEMGATDSGPRSADVVATTDVEVLGLESKDLVGAISARPELAIMLIGALSRRVRDLIGRLEDMAFHDATHRVMRVLLNVATASYEARGVPVIEGLTHYEIATLAGTSRETASRVISNLGRDGMVGTRGRKIVVDLFALRDLIEKD
jgi:CRP/FNR family transcriptional regulator/CRP/FNR family cyclic AMP-dependent transcriptional regulator